MDESLEEVSIFGSSNRRRYVREQVRIESNLWTDNFYTKVVLTELAEGGFSVTNTQPLETGSTVHVSFDLPNTDATIRCDGRVVWCRTSEERTGVEFTRLSESDHMILTGWLARYRAGNC